MNIFVQIVLKKIKLFILLFVRTVANERKKFTLFEELIFELKKNSLLCFFFIFLKTQKSS